MKTLIDNWFIIVVLIAFTVMVIDMVIRFLQMPTSKQISNVKEWLKFAVIEAEIALGSGTGQLKLRMVYDMALMKFNWLGKVVTFERFSEWVDESLEWMNHQLSTNNNISNIVKSAEEA